MKIRNQILILGLISLVMSCTPQKQTDYQEEISIIPRPLDMKKSSGQLSLSEGLVVFAKKDNDEALKVANRFATDMSRVTGWDIQVTTLDTDQLPDQNQILFTTVGVPTDLGEEAYILESTEKGVIIRATSGSGLFYGMQTLKQLLPTAIYAQELQQDVVWTLPLVQISDQPRFKWRGLHLDVCRNMSSIAFIKEYIDNMAMHKLNTFHWHLTDDQGWRIEIKKYPKLTEIGGFRKESLTITSRNQPKVYDGKRYGGYYTQEQIKEIIAYAADRYITVIPEIELPGHATAAVAAYPELGSSGERPEVEVNWGIFPDIFNVEDSTFLFLENVLAEVIELFPSQYIHIGGDEAMKVQWEESAQIQAKMKELGVKDAHELQSYFITRIEKFVNSKGRQIIGWDEILEGGLAPNAAVMSWRGESGGIAAAKSQHNVVMSPDRFLYLDYHQGDPKFEPTVIGRLLTLENVYAYDPMPDALSVDEQKYIMGVQANVWTEYMPTEDQIEYQVYPRVSALAEVVWSKEANKDWVDFKNRIPKQLARFDMLDINYAKSIYFVSMQSESNTEGNYQITLSNQMNEPGMKYTLDGSKPSLASQEYVEPITASQGQTIKAQLFIDEVAVGKMTEFEVGMVD
ncbi:family 20 glycosylhydrolase [Reichenbachiella agarivorans]|uniref:beta-N-acetylhexosaminidase n=1 Tax=Reichenbachiella agarivorans TaxID=2979464 RepID=A0ABY6CTL0_9BACT|nr:family 20 glycosylhydrolase [Reichenbachiella agarivorans]UXP33861.1 family 20 glycosylhydrolase [Reichenbachiella agarivorans]